MLQNGEDLSAARATLSLVVVLAPVAVIVRIILAVLTVQSVARQIVARVGVVPIAPVVQVAVMIPAGRRAGDHVGSGKPQTSHVRALDWPGDG